ncbi:MAG: hypothetical protein R6X25_16515 [Candidatus Krumholzibacteriia bacterium]
MSEPGHELDAVLRFARQDPAPPAYLHDCIVAALHGRSRERRRERARRRRRVVHTALVVGIVVTGGVFGLPEALISDHHELRVVGYGRVSGKPVLAERLGRYEVIVDDPADSESMARIMEAYRAGIGPVEDVIVMEYDGHREEIVRRRNPVDGAVWTDSRTDRPASWYGLLPYLDELAKIQHDPDAEFLGTEEILVEQMLFRVELYRKQTPVGPVIRGAGKPVQVPAISR